MPGNGLIWNIGLVVVSVPMLYVGAECLVRGAAMLGRAMRIRPMVIGLTICAFATSAPELVVGLTANLSGFPDIAVGNVIGANVANSGLSIGLVALIVPVAVHRTIWRKEVPAAIGAQVLLFVFCLSGRIDRYEGMILVAVLLLSILYVIKTAKTGEEGELPAPLKKGAVRPLWNVFQVVVGIVLLPAGGYLLVHSATTIADAAGITHLTIGATLVALLTVAPEFTTSLIAARRGEGEIAIGNAVGTVFFNTAFVLGLSASLIPLKVASETAFVKIPFMIVLMLVLIPFTRSGAKVSRWEGALLLVCYVGFVVYCILTGGVV